MEFARVVKNDESVVMFAKMQVDGHGTGLEKSDWLKIIEGRAADIYGDTITPQRAFAKTITEDETGRLLYKALRAAPGPEVKPAPPEKLHAEDDQFHGKPAHALLHSLAVDHAKAHSMSYSRAYAHLYGKPEHVALRDQIRREHLAQTMARANG